MKNIVFLLLITFLVSCSSESDTCNCKAKYQSFNGGVYFINNQSIDCTTGLPTEPQSNGFFVGCVD
jgi:hypothetical protein